MMKNKVAPFYLGHGVSTLMNATEKQMYHN